MQERGSGASFRARPRKLPLSPSDLYVFADLAVCNGGPRIAPAGRTVLRTLDNRAPIAKARAFVPACADRSGVRRRRTVCGVASLARKKAGLSQPQTFAGRRV